MTDQVWTHGTWTVVPGREDDFVAAWERLGEWTVADFPGSRGTLLRDTEQPNVFVSFGPWPDRETVGRWRGSPEFQEQVGAIQEMLEGFEARLLDFVATAE